MKHAKLYGVLICAGLLAGCEKEALNMNDEEARVQEKTTFSEFVNSGVDVNQYISDVVDHEVRSKSLNKSHEAASYDETIFDTYCNDLSEENFESGTIGYGTASTFLGPLNSSTSHSRFTEGIIEGINISSGQDHLVIFGYSYGIATKIVTTNYIDDALTIDFSADNITGVSFDVYSFPFEVYSSQNYPLPPDFSQEVLITITYGNGQVVTEEIIASATGVFYGTIGNAPISEVTISSADGDAFVGVDNINFGTCTVPDSDDDGCLDDSDDNDSSNMEPSVVIGDCDSGVPNRSTATCGISLSDVVDDLENKWYKNKGAFVSDFAEQANQMVSDDLISEEEKELLMSCAAKFSL